MAACGSYCPPNRNIRERVGDSAIVGKWRLTEESLRHLVRDGFRREPSHRYTISFNPDHSCEFASILQFSRPEYVASPCTWRLEHDVDKGATANRLQIEVHLARRYFYTLDFARADGILILWDYYSDPDLWQFLEYVRTDPESK